jgi:hypothetical protein
VETYPTASSPPYPSASQTQPYPTSQSSYRPPSHYGPPPY